MTLMLNRNQSVFVGGQNVSDFVKSIAVEHSADGITRTIVTLGDGARVEEVGGGGGGGVFRVVRTAAPKPEEPIFKQGDKVRLTPKHYLYEEGLNNNAVIDWVSDLGHGHLSTERKVEGSVAYGTHFKEGEIEHRKELAVGDRVRVKGAVHRFLSTQSLGTVTEIVTENDGATHPRVVVDGGPGYAWHIGNDDIEAI
jgi:hypothetical protein